MIKIYEYSALNNDEIFDRANPTGDVSGIVSDIIEDVKANGDEALFRYCEKFDKAKLSSLEVTNEEIEEAISAVEPEFIRIIEKAAENRFRHSRAPNDFRQRYFLVKVIFDIFNAMHNKLAVFFSGKRRNVLFEINTAKSESSPRF